MAYQIDASILEKVALKQTLDLYELDEYRKWQKSVDDAQKMIDELAAQVQAQDGIIATIIPKAQTQITKLSQIASDLGDVIAGRFIAPASTATNTEPTNSGFSGTFMSADGESFLSDTWHIGGVNAGTLQFGLSATDGKAYFGAGSAIIDEDGVTLPEGDISATVADTSSFKWDDANGNIVSYIQSARAFSDTASSLIWSSRSMTAGGSINSFIQAQMYTFDNGDSSYGFLLDSGVYWVLFSHDDDGQDETTFNSGNNDIDFIVNGDNGRVLQVNAGLDRLEIMDLSTGAVHILDGAGTTYFNEPNNDVDVVFEGTTDSNLITVDAGLDAVGMGGAAESGYKLKVTGDVRITGDLTVDGSFGGVTPETNANDIYRCTNSPGGTSAWAGTINGAPSGTSVVYSTSSGTAASMKPNSTSQLGKMVLHNTTRGDSALISDVNTGTTTITLTATVPGTWQNGDSITIASQTVSGGGYAWVDIKIASGPTGKTALFVNAFLVHTANNTMRLHPYETWAASKHALALTAQVTGQTSSDHGALLPITSDTFALSWEGSPTAVIVREVGYIV